MPFLPRDFVVPVVVETVEFRMRMLSIHDLVKDYDAVMSSREHLWHRFGVVWGWPKPGMTLEQNLIDLGWHQKEFQRRSSFAYTVVSRDESRTLGCVYIDPPTISGTQAEVWFWARQSELAGGLEGRLDSHIRRWLQSEWGFRTVSLNGQATGPCG